MVRAGGDVPHPEREPTRPRWASGQGGLTRRVGAGRLCYDVHMKAKRQRRAGATETFSVSVDAETKRALRKLAAAEFGGNLSALVTDFAEEARRRVAAAAYLRAHGIPKLTPAEADALETQIEREIAAASPRVRRRRGAA